MLFNGGAKKSMASAKRKSKLNCSSNKKSSAGQYVVCVNNWEYPASLEARKIYKVIADKTAAKSGLVRIIDESGEDYLYPADYFLPIKLPRTIEKAAQLES